MLRLAQLIAACAAHLKKSNPHGSSSPHSALVRCGFMAPCGRRTVPIHHAAAAIPRGVPMSWHLRLPRRGGILHVRYATSRPADCICHRTGSPAPRPPPLSSMCVPGECSSVSIPAVLRPSPHLGQAPRKEVRHKPGPGQA
jgi:hypothetical protein